MITNLSLGHFRNVNSFFHRLDPRLKFFILLIFTVLVFLSRNIFVLTLIFLTSVVCFFLKRSPLFYTHKLPHYQKSRSHSPRHAWRDAITAGDPSQPGKNRIAFELPQRGCCSIAALELEDHAPDVAMILMAR